jgi:hypothetical protein
MTDITLLNTIQTEAVAALLNETLTHIQQCMHERYVALGKENAKLLNVRDTRFISKGMIYPPVVGNIIPYGSHVPSLHYSLLSELNSINDSMAQADSNYIKNFFIAVVSQSHNAIVLDALLPTVLVNFLKQKFGTQTYKILDTGICGVLQQEPISITQQNIVDIKKHYHATITTIQHLLMDKLLLQI